MNAKWLVLSVTALVLLSGLPGATLGQEATPDQYEPNDSIEQATQVTEGTTTASLDSADDVDYYAIQVRNGDVLEARLEPENESVDLDLEIFGTDRESRERAEYNQRQRGFEALAVEAFATGAFFVRVDGAAATNYTLNLTRLEAAPVTRRANEPSDDFEDAIDVGGAQTVTGDIYPTGDRDIYRVNLSAGETLTVTPSFNSSMGHLVVSIYDPTRLELIETRVRGETGFTGVTANESGSYYVMVFGQYGALLSYELDVATRGGTEEPPSESAASVGFDDQTTDGAAVLVRSVDLSEGGFVVVHDETGAVVGASEYLGPGTASNVVVSLSEPLTESQELVAMAHRDTNGNEAFDFVETDGTEDGPYLDEVGNPVVDDATVTVDREEDETETETATTTADSDDEQSALGSPRWTP